MIRKYRYMIAMLLMFVAIQSIHAQTRILRGLPDGAIARLGKGGINIMRFSPDGTHLAVGTTISVWLYNVESGKEIVLNQESVGYFHTLAFSSDGKILATDGFTDPAVHLWDLETGSKLSSFSLPKTFGLSALAFSEDNKKLTSLGIESIIEWDIGTEQQIFKKQYTNSWPVVAFAEDGKTFVYGDQIEGEISLWDPVRGTLGDVFRLKQLSAFERFLSELLGGMPNDRKIKKSIQAIALSPDGNTVASAHDDNIIRLWDAVTGTERVKLKGHNAPIETFAFSSDGTILASGSLDKQIILWDVRKGRRKSILLGHQHGIVDLAFSPIDKSLLASASADGTIRFWNTKTGKETSIFANRHPEYILDIAFSKDNTMLFSASSNGYIDIWNVRTGNFISSNFLSQKDEFYAYAFSKDASLFATHDGNVFIKSEGYYQVIKKEEGTKRTRLLKLPDGKEIGKFPQEAKTFTFSPNNKILATYTEHGRIELWDIKTRKKMFGWIVEESFFRHLVFSTDNRMLAAYGHETPTQLWDVNNKQEITPDNIKEVSALAFSPDSSFFALKNSMGIEIWYVTRTNIQKHKTISLESKQGYGQVLIFSPDGKILLFPKWKEGQHLIQLWDIDTGKGLIALHSGHTSYIETLTFSHDDKILASGSLDGTILLWDWEKIITKTKENKGD